MSTILVKSDEHECIPCNKVFKNASLYYLHLVNESHKIAEIEKMADDQKKELNDKSSIEVKQVLKEYLQLNKKLLDDLIRKLN
jgi:hypothetical protein